MTKAALKFINDTLENAGINYDFAERKRGIIYPYWVGEYADLGAENEDGMSEYSFTLNGWTRGEWLDLENERETVESFFSDCTTILENGSGIDISYAGAQIIPTGDAELKRMQINLNIKEWKVTV